MEDNIEDLVVKLTTTSSCDDICSKLINFLQEFDVKYILKFISENFHSLYILEHWSWEVLSKDSNEWINESKYFELFYQLSLFNKNLIFISDEIDSDKKASLLIPETIDIIDDIFEQIEKLDDENNSYFILISLWFDNLSYFIYENTQYVMSSIITHIDHSIAYKFLMTDQYKYYFKQLKQSQISETIFTNKQLFYIKTCSFSISSYFFCQNQKFPFTGDDVLRSIAEDYLEIIYLHSFNVQSWSKELLYCITHIISFICTCCWWTNDKLKRIKLLLPTDEISYNHIQSLIRILSYKTFHEEIQIHRSNEQTILIGNILDFLLTILETHDFVCFMRFETKLLDILLPLAEISKYNRINVCSYRILGEILCDEHIKELKITNNLCEYFFYMLEQAWNRPTQKFQRISVQQLLRGFLSLAKNDTIQQKTADTNKVSLFIEMSDEYPIVFDILWTLSFNHDIQQQLRSNQKLMFKLTDFNHDLNNEQMKKITHGILWNLKSIDEERPISEKLDDAMFDIMISYSHKDKILCKQIYDELVRIGYHVWIDFDQMHGNVMDAMAQAIEKSNTIIICMSEQYRRSNYCRAEAYYAFQRQLKIVPVLLEKHYKPDGWLLFLIGQLLYIDFTKYEFSVATEKLITELKAPVFRLESKTTTEIITANVPLPLPGLLSTSVLPPVVSKNMLEWTQTDVQNWLIVHNLIQMSRLLSDYDGSSLIYLYKYLTHTNESHEILKLLQEDSLRRTNQSLSVIELARFQTLMDQQQQPVLESRNLKKRTKKFNKRHKQSRLNFCPTM